MTRPEIPRLLLVTNRRSAILPLPDLIEQAMAGGVEAVQIREKDLESDQLCALIQQMLDRGVPRERLIVNGNADIAERLQVGLHLPEALSDQPFRDSLPGWRSRAVHSPAAAAAVGDVDFLIAGHVFATRSKPNQPPLGLEGLRAIAAANPVPVLAIGGLTPERVPSIVRMGAIGIAVMSAINDAPDPKAAAAAFRNALEHDR